MVDELSAMIRRIVKYAVALLLIALLWKLLVGEDEELATVDRIE